MSTYVLVHGAWHGGWSWRWVREILEKHNHRVFTPTMIGLGEREHLMSLTISIDDLVSDIVQTINHLDLKGVILVGHSFGGAVISAVAERVRERIKQIIYIDAAILENNECMFDCMPQEVAAARKDSAKKHKNNLSMSVPTAAELGISEHRKWELIASHLSPQPLSTYSTSLTLQYLPGEGFSCNYIVCVAPMYKPLGWARERVEKYGWPIIPIEAGHEAMVCDAGKLSEMLMRLTD